MQADAALASRNVHALSSTSVAYTLCNSTSSFPIVFMDVIPCCCYLRVSCECTRDVVRETPDVDESPLEPTAVTLA